MDIQGTLRCRTLSELLVDGFEIRVNDVFNGVAVLSDDLVDIVWRRLI